MSELLTPDLCILGGGAAGLLIAAGASQMGASVVLVEAGRMGGDCLNTGCVPSKALLAAAHAAEAMRRGFAGVSADAVAVDFPAVMHRVRTVIDEIAVNDSVARFEGLGVTVIRAHGRFADPRTVEAGGRAIRARRFVVATGADPILPGIPGLLEAPFLTHQTIFDLRERPDHLLVLGGGPVGVELAQAFRRLGSAVTLFEAKTLLPRDDAELVEVVRTALRRDGIGIVEGEAVTEIESAPLRVRRGADTVAGSHLLVAVGRRPHLDGLGLDAAKIAHDGAGIRVDPGLRTTNRRVYAVGDVIGGPQFTHLAAHQAGLVLRSALFRLPVRNDLRALPSVLFTEPELAQVGMTEETARAAFGRVQVLRCPFADTDRARTDDALDGLAKIVLDGRGRIVGAGIVGRHAGELIHPWCLAIAQNLKIGAMAGTMTPYPTLSEVSKKAAGSWFMPKLFSDRVKRLVRLLAHLP